MMESEAQNYMPRVKDQIKEILYLQFGLMHSEVQVFLTKCSYRFADPIADDLVVRTEMFPGDLQARANDLRNAIARLLIENGHTDGVAIRVIGPFILEGPTVLIRNGQVRDRIDYPVQPERSGVRVPTPPPWVYLTDPTTEADESPSPEDAAPNKYLGAFVDAQTVLENGGYKVVQGVVYSVTSTGSFWVLSTDGVQRPCLGIPTIIPDRDLPISRRNWLQERRAAYNLSAPPESEA